MRPFELGESCALDGVTDRRPWTLPPERLVTHSVITGMTSSGKTGLVTVLMEEALRSGVPVIAVDVKGDLPNLLLSFPSAEARYVRPWVGAMSAPGGDEAALDARAVQLAAERAESLDRWGIGPAQLADYVAKTQIRVLTPGSTAGEPLHVLSGFEHRSARWESDPEAARASLCAAISLVLRLVGRDPDPARSRDHVLLSVLAERRLRAGDTAALGALLGELANPPIAEVGALKVDAYMRKSERNNLAASLNNLLASPTFEAWRQGAPLDVDAWTTPRDGRTPLTVVSVAHLDDEERSLVLGVLLEEVLAWVRAQPGTQGLRALVVFDEVYGFLPPHPANPPTKRPLVALMKQARAFGVGVVVATQNPMDLDYRALGNAGIWCVGRLQTDADRERIVEGMSGARGNESQKALSALIRRLGHRWFVMHDIRAGAPRLVRPRYAISLLRGPMTRSELELACTLRR